MSNHEAGSGIMLRHCYAEPRAVVEPIIGARSSPLRGKSIEKTVGGDGLNAQRETPSALACISVSWP
jgi:hypothetical protein